jgi:hypothetical protein
LTYKRFWIAYYLSQNFDDITLRAEYRTLEIVEHNWNVLGRKANLSTEN